MARTVWLVHDTFTLSSTACDSSCTSCFPNNPNCMSCPPGAALHHGKCVTQCPPRHYQDDHLRCRGERILCGQTRRLSLPPRLTSPGLCCQSATAPAPHAGVPPCPSAHLVQVDSTFTRASVWRAVGRGCTTSTLAATVSAHINWKDFFLLHLTLFPTAQTATPPAVPVWDHWPQTASAAGRQMKCCNQHPSTWRAASAWRDVHHTASWMKGVHAEVSKAAAFLRPKLEHGL